jgi:hypothetical protein
MSNNENIQNVLQILKELDKTNSFEVYLPSLQKTVPFKQLNTEQLKKLLKTVIDSPIHNTEFITSFNSIIKENILDETINVDDLNVFDKLLILVKTRIESISPDYTFNFTEEEISELNLPEKTFLVKLSDSYNNFVSSAPIFDKEVIKSNTYEVTASLPTIQTENKLEKELYKNVKLEITTPEELRNTIGDTFINELTKYISILKVEDTTIDLNTLTFKNRIKIVEQLPTSVINGVLKYVEKYKNIIKPLVTYTNNSAEKDIPQDATFFNM